jgi:hypothetical protein
MGKHWSGSPKGTASKSAGTNPSPRAVMQDAGNGKSGVKVKPQGMNPAQSLSKKG